MSNRLQDLQKLGQSVWYDNIDRGLIRTGELERLIRLGVSGLTSNPTIFEKAISGSAEYDAALANLAEEGRGRHRRYTRPSPSRTFGRRLTSCALRMIEREAQTATLVWK